MAMSPSRPDPSSPSEVASASFSVARRGFEPDEVRDLLRMVAAELARLQERERFLERELRTAQRANASTSVTIDEELVTRMLGEEAARVLQTAREGAAQIKQRSEEGAARLLREVTDEAQRIREEAEVEASRRRADATADAEAEIEMAKQQGREMVNEARAYRERVLSELARRRELARQQIEQLVHGRERLLQAFERARLVSVDVMAELTPLGQPAELVDLSPTTGPIPLMVPNERLSPALPRRPEVAPEAEDDTVALVLPQPEPATNQPAVHDVVEDRIDDPVPEPDVIVLDVIVPDVIVPEVVVPEVVVRDAVETDDDDDGAFDAVFDERDEEYDLEAIITVIDDEGGVEQYQVDSHLDAEHRVRDVVPVRLDIPHSPQADESVDDALDDRQSAPVVALFPRAVPDLHEAADDVDDVDARVEPSTDSEADAVLDDDEDDDEPEPTGTDVSAPVPTPHHGRSSAKTSVDELFARLRASTSDSIARRAAAPLDVVQSPTASDAADSPDGPPVASAPAPAPITVGEVPADSVFAASPERPATAAATDDSPFARRDEALTPIIVGAARRLKRVLADEQNEVLATLRRAEPVRSLDVIVPSALEHGTRYAACVDADLLDAALAGAASMGVDPGDLRRRFATGGVTRPADDVLVAELVQPLRERLGRAVTDADGDNGELGNLVRTVYREWKNQRIDEQLDDVVRSAFGRGALAAALPTGMPVCWSVDPSGPACADAEDNVLGGVVRAGEGFPTDDQCAPAHPGCRCMIVPALP